MVLLVQYGQYIGVHLWRFDGVPCLLCVVRLRATFGSGSRWSSQTSFPLQWQEDRVKESSRAELWAFLWHLCEGNLYAYINMSCKTSMANLIYFSRQRLYCLVLNKCRTSPLLILMLYICNCGLTQNETTFTNHLLRWYIFYLEVN